MKIILKAFAFVLFGSALGSALKLPTAGRLLKNVIKAVGRSVEPKPTDFVGQAISGPPEHSLGIWVVAMLLIAAYLVWRISNK